MSAQNKSGKTTIRTVAADAGVSVAAVSKVLRNAYGVSDALRTKVEESIDKLDYRPSTAARGMRGKTFNIGILLVEMQNPFLPSVVSGVKEVLSEAKYSSLIGVGEARASIERPLIDSMIDIRMDGVLLIAPRISGEMLAHYARQIPMVVIGHHEPAAQTFDTVNADDHAGARLAVEALLADGRRDIHMTSLQPRSDDDFDVFSQREAGYLAAMQDAGLAEKTHIWRLCEKPDMKGLPAEMVLDASLPPDALFCWSDIHAIELLNLARNRGIDVPGKLAIVGFDNTPIAGLPLIGLSSVDQKGSELGRVAAASLLTRIAGRKVAEHHLIEPYLVSRASS